MNGAVGQDCGTSDIDIFPVHLGRQNDINGTRIDGSVGKVYYANRRLPSTRGGWEGVSRGGGDQGIGRDIK